METQIYVIAVTDIGSVWKDTLETCIRGFSRTWFSTGGNCFPGWHSWETVLACYDLGTQLGTSGGQRPGVLLKPYSEQDHPPKQRLLYFNISRVPRLRNFAVDHTIRGFVAIVGPL